MLVDFDLRRPGLHKICDLENNRRVSYFGKQCINGSQNLNELVKKTSIEIHPNLFILPSGGKTRAATEMLEQKGYDLVQDELRKEFDVVIIDSPPIGLFP